MQPLLRTGNDFDFNTAPAAKVIAALLYVTDHEDLESDEILESIVTRAYKERAITERQLSLVRVKLCNYKRELQDVFLDTNHGIDVVSAFKKPESIGKKCFKKANRFELKFDYDPVLVDRIKCISGRRWDSITKTWSIPVSEDNTTLLQSMGFTIPGAAIPTLKPRAEICLSQLKKGLRQYQLTGIQKMADFGMRALLADEMGAGKTAQALSLIQAQKNKMLPAIIVCPASLKWNWAREANMWTDGCFIRILSGMPDVRSYKAQENELTIVNYDILSNRKSKKGWAALLSNAGYKTLILDECHKIKNMESARTQSVMNLGGHIPYIIGISGTPIENRPKEFFPILNLIVPNLFPLFWSFGHRYCGPSNNGYGWSFDGASNVEELHTILTDHVMIRRLKKDILKELPAKTRTVVPVEINMNEYRKAENDLRSYVQKMKGEKPKKGDSVQAIQMIEKCKQAAVVGKLNFAIEWIEDFLESDNKLIVFCTHQFVVDALIKKFKNISVKVDGSVTGTARQKAVDLFQGDPAIKLFVGNIKAAGVGITLTAASASLTLELGWTPGEHDQADDRCHRIGQENAVTSYYMVAKDTIEESIAELLDKKRQILAAVMDNRKVQDIDLLTILLSAYKGEE